MQDQACELGGNGRPVAGGKVFCEFFAGIGLVDEGLRPGGWRCVYANDVDDRKRRMHATRNGPAEYFHLEDVTRTDVVVARIPGAPFLATASFPCVDLSLAGHYRGFDGKQSSTFFAFIDVLEQLGDRRPKLVMLENVVGFLSARKGEDFRAAVRALADLGYWVDAFVLDAGRFLPQSRPRVFVIGMAEEVKPAAPRRPFQGLLTDVAEPSPLRPAAVLRCMAGLELPTGWAPLALPTPPPRRVQLEDVIDLDDGQDWWDETQVERHYRMMHDYHSQRIDAFRASNTPFVGTIFRRVRKGGQRAEVRFDGLAGCLRTPRGGSGRQIVVAVQNGRLRLRWMSPREYARLQGAPDFPLDLPTNQLLMGFADAVCVPVIRWIDQHVLTPLFEAATGENGHARQPDT